MAKRKASTSSKPAAGKGEAISARRWMVRYSLALVLAGMLALAWVSCLSHHPGDPPAAHLYDADAEVHNLAGGVGAILSHHLFYWLGKGAYMGLLFSSMAVLLVILGGQVRELGFRLIGVARLSVGASTAVYMVRPYSSGGQLFGSGGVLGAACGTFAQRHFGWSAWVLVLVVELVGLILAADKLVLQLPRVGRRLWARREHLAKMTSALRAVTKGAATAERESAPMAVTAKPRAAAAGRAEAKPLRPTRVSITQDPPGDGADDAEALLPAGGVEAPAVATAEAAPRAISDRLKSLVAAAAPAKAKRSAKPAKPAKPSEPGKAGKAAGAGGEYPLPGEEMLIDAEHGYRVSQEAQVELKRAVLQQTLDDFNVDAKVVGHMTGPVITLFEMSLAPGVKVSQVANLANDIARALAAPGVRIVSPIPGKDTIGIEVPNAQKETVRIKELMNLNTTAARRLHLPLYLGKDAGGDPIVADLGTMPHMLIAGTTGSGKSVCINSIIMSMLLTRRPSDVRLILVDPKMVEMAAFERLPHLLCPIVNDMRKAESIIEWAATKMDERYELLRDAGVRNLAAYNKLGAKEIYCRLGAETDEERAQVQTKIARHVIIIDELADLIMTSSKEVEGFIIRIAQKARAVGIHLILATQRPSVNVVTGLIKSNMPCRISFRVASRQESRIVLDQNGAEVLLGRGDMLFLQPGTSNLTRAQGTFLDDNEIRGVVDYLSGQDEAVFNQELVAMRPAGLEEDAGGERDEMFDKAVEIILQNQRGSVSLLQRRLSVGYSRASRIVDQMAEAGILGDYKGSQARECLLTLDDWHALKADIEADQSGANALDGEGTSD